MKISCIACALTLCTCMLYSHSLSHPSINKVETTTHDGRRWWRWMYSWWWCRKTTCTCCVLSLSEHDVLLSSFCSWVIIDYIVCLLGMMNKWVMIGAGEKFSFYFFLVCFACVYTFAWWVLHGWVVSCMCVCIFAYHRENGKRQGIFCGIISVSIPYLTDELI